MLTVGSVAIRVDDLPGEIAFWTAALDYAAREPVGDGFALLHPRDLCADDQDAEVRRLEALGACRVHGDKQPPDADDIIMEDPEGNRFCVVAAGEAGARASTGRGRMGHGVIHPRMPPEGRIVQIRNSSDWRDALPFELPVAAAEAVPGDATRCSGCGPTSEPWPREALWVVKHRHPTNPAGFVRFYCADHKPAAKLAPVAAAAPERARRTRAAAGSAAPRKAPAPIIPEREAVLCPDCFVQVPATGVCGMCGARVG